MSGVSKSNGSNPLRSSTFSRSTVTLDDPSCSAFGFEAQTDFDLRCEAATQVRGAIDGGHSR
jgi:hypothetical protein